MGRAKQRKKRSKNKGLISLFILLLLVVVVFVITTRSSVFDIEKITVIGNNKVSTEKIKSSSEIIKGENIFKADLKNAEENLLLHSYIKRADIKRKLPDEIVINITERGEIAIIPHADSLVYVGFEGRVLDIVEEKKAGRTPVLKGLELDKPSIGLKIVLKKKTKQETDDIINFLEMYSSKGLKKQTRSIEFDKQIEAYLKLNSQGDVAFGRLNNIEYKMTFLIETLKDLEKKKIKAKTIYLNKGKDVIVELTDS